MVSSELPAIDAFHVNPQGVRLFLHLEPFEHAVVLVDVTRQHFRSNLKPALPCIQNVAETAGSAYPTYNTTRTKCDSHVSEADTVRVGHAEPVHSASVQIRVWRVRL